MRTIAAAATAVLALLPTPARAATVSVVEVDGIGSYRSTVVYAGTCTYSEGVMTASGVATAVDSTVPATVWTRCFFMDAEYTSDLGGIEASGLVAANTASLALPPGAAWLCGTVIAYHPGLYASTGPGRAGNGWCRELVSV